MYRPKGIDPLADPSDEMRSVLLRSLAEICGLSRGFCRGRGGSMHLQWHEAGAVGTKAIVGGGVPLTAGYAWAHRHSGSDAVAVTYFGDGATVRTGPRIQHCQLARRWPEMSSLCTWPCRKHCSTCEMGSVRR